MIETKIKSYTLKSGYDMPALGLGTWELTGRTCEEIIPVAIEMGYRHIDTAELYENEGEIGNAIKGFNRESLFITSKVASTNLNGNDLRQACQRSIKKLGTDYLDLYLVHWPNESIDLAETLEAMQELVEQGMIRSVGLSNFEKQRTEKALSISSVPICNLQIEYHPFTKRKELPEFCKANEITITAYSPLARGKVFKNQTLKKIAEKYQKSAAQVSLKWLLQKGNIVIPKASSQDHLEQNMELFDWQLDLEDIERIDNIQNQRRLVDTQYT